MFKIGDKVRINCTDRFYSAKGKFDMNGLECVINKIRKPGTPYDAFIYSLTSLNDNTPCNPSTFLWSEKELELVKTKFNIKNYPGKYVMCCKTHEESQIFSRYLNSIGKTWLSGGSYLQLDYYSRCDQCISYNFNNGTYDHLDYYKNEKYTILEFEDFDWSDFEMKKEFTKADLKNGDVIKRRDDSIEIVLVDTGTLLNEAYGAYNLKDIHDDLTSNIGSSRDVIAVRRPTKWSDCCFGAFSRNEGTLVYERKEVEEMTLEEVCKALGKEIKIVKK